MQQPANEHQRILSLCETFSGLPEEMLSELLGRMTEISFETGEKLIRQEAPGDSLQLLLEGRAAVVVVAGMDDPTEVKTSEFADAVIERM